MWLRKLERGTCHAATTFAISRFFGKMKGMTMVCVDIEQPGPPAAPARHG